MKHTMHVGEKVKSVNAQVNTAGKLRVVLISYHFYGSKKKAGFHFLANEFRDMGHDVVFVTGLISLLSILRFDKRIKEKGFFENLIKDQKLSGVTSVINKVLFHPASVFPGFVNTMLTKLLKPQKKLLKYVAQADVVIFESDPSIAYVNQLKFKNGCQKIYRVSDSMEMLGVPIQLLEIERDALPLFDLISCPNQKISDALHVPHAQVLHHGIDKSVFDNNNQLSPYLEGTINHVFVGVSYLDLDFIDIASKVFPDHYFHIFGPFSPRSEGASNVFFYGYTAFDDLVPYIKYASVGLHALTNERNVASTMGDSLKVQQYTYCQLPVVAPSVIESDRENFFFYEYNNPDSIRDSINQALLWPRDTTTVVLSWSEVAQGLLGGGG